MKKLFLKSGVKLLVKVEETQPTQEDSGRKYIQVWEDDVNVYSVAQPNRGGIYAILHKGNIVEWHQITEIAEITENFNQYFNLLNQ